MQPKFPIIYSGGGRERKQPLQRRIRSQSFRAPHKLNLHLLIMEYFQGISIVLLQVLHPRDQERLEVGIF